MFSVLARNTTSCSTHVSLNYSRRIKKGREKWIKLQELTPLHPYPTCILLKSVFKIKFVCFENLNDYGLFIFKHARRERCLEVEHRRTASVTKLDFSVFTASNTTILIITRSLVISWLQLKFSIDTISTPHVKDMPMHNTENTIQYDEGLEVLQRSRCIMVP